MSPANIDRCESDDKVVQGKIEVISHRERAQSTVQEEEGCSVWEVIRKNPKVVFWCLFFAFSSVGW